MSCPVTRKKADRVQEPVFMFCVGATKAGTSWVHRQLRMHPECYIRTIKEYHYFTLNDPKHWEKRLGELTAELAELSSISPADRTLYHSERLSDITEWAKVIAAQSFDFARFRDFHMAGLHGRKLVADFTPAYALLSVKALRNLKVVGQDVRIVYLIRDPLARLWSHIRMSSDRAVPDDFEGGAQDLLRRTLAGETAGGIQGMMRRGDYLGNLPKLKKAFDAKRLLVMFTEDVMTATGFARLLAFLGLGPHLPDLQTRVHAGRELDIPSDLRAQALRLLRPQYDYIASEFSALPEVWRRNMNEAMA